MRWPGISKAKVIEKYYGKPYDIEFAIDADLPFPDNIIILQVRPESVWSHRKIRPKAGGNMPVIERIVRALIQGIAVE